MGVAESRGGGFLCTATAAAPPPVRCCSRAAAGGVSIYQCMQQKLGGTLLFRVFIVHCRINPDFCVLLLPAAAALEACEEML